MIHSNRTFQILEEVTSIGELAETLTQHTWTLCSAFKLTVDPSASPLIFLNDSFSENGAQEYTVVWNGRQIESITFSWCARGEAYNHIASLVRGDGVGGSPLALRLETPDTHRCHLCR